MTLGIADKQDLQTSLLMHLQRGRNNARNGNELAGLFGLKDDRSIRIAIRDLIGRGYPIASAVSKPTGYYLIESDKEATEYINNLKARIREDALRLRDFSRASRARVEPEQLRFKINA